MAGRNVLIVEDEERIRDATIFALEKAGYSAQEASDAHIAEARLANDPPDLILLDRTLPDVSGSELARRWKNNDTTRDIPIIMLTARTEEGETVRGLETGADDYVTKPFSPRELIARIKAVFRRAVDPASQSMLYANGLELDTVAHRVTAAEHDVDLGPTGFRLLAFFMGHPERAFSRGQLLDHVWDCTTYIDERTVDVHIRRLRKALQPSGHENLVQTVRGTGYRFSTRA
jgi:two-component system phosphate regulon response regulator PhoB